MDAIKAALLALSERERIEVENWLSDQWDGVMQDDFSPGGRGDRLVERVDADIDAGGFRPLDRH